MSTRTAGVIRGGPLPAWLAGVAFAAVAVTTRLPGLLSPRVVNPDESTVGTMGRVMAGGGRLYSDVVDRKPPLLPLLYWALDQVSGGLADLRWARIVVLGAVAATSWLLAGEANRRSGTHLPPALLAVFGIAVFTLLPARDTQSVSFEALAVLPATAAFIAAARGRTAAGALLTAVATLGKQTFVLGLLPVLYHAHRRGGWPRVARDGLLYVVAVSAIAPFFGGQPFFYWSFLEAAGYASDPGTLVRSAVALVLMLALLALLVSGPLVLAVPLLRRLDRDLLLWLAGGVIAYVAGLRFLTHYAFQLLPPLALVAMCGLAVAGPLRRRIGLVLTAVVCAIWMVAGAGTSVARDRYEPVADYVEAVTAPGEHIFVWGQSSQVYWQSERLPAARFPHIQFLTNLTPRPGDTGESMPDYVTTASSWHDLWLDFRRHPPALIIDTTAIDGGSLPNADILRSPLQPYLTAAYERAANVDGVEVWRRVAVDGPVLP